MDIFPKRKEVDQELVAQIQGLIDKKFKETGEQFEIKIEQIGNYETSIVNNFKHLPFRCKIPKAEELIDTTDTDFEEWLKREGSTRDLNSIKYMKDSWYNYKTFMYNGQPIHIKNYLIDSLDDLHKLSGNYENFKDFHDTRKLANIDFVDIDYSKMTVYTYDGGSISICRPIGVIEYI